VEEMLRDELEKINKDIQERRAVLDELKKNNSLAAAKIRERNQELQGRISLRSSGRGD
jgi:hypothetical protein